MDLMTSPAVTVGPDTTVKAAAQLLAEHDVSALPVVDGAGRLLGIVSEVDLLPLETRPDPAAAQRPIPSRVQDLMTSDVCAVEAEAGVALVAQLMLQMVVKRMPVLRDDRVVGVVSRRDLVALLARPDEEIERRVREVLSREGLRFAPAGVRVHDGIVELSGAERDTLQRAQSLARAEPGVFDVRLREA